MSVMEVFAKAIKSDPEGASALMNEVVYSYLADQAKEMQPELESLYGTFIANNTAIAKRAIAKSYVESTVNGTYPDEDIQQTAKWLSGIEQYIVSKAIEDEFFQDYNGVRVRRTVNRDVRGRFARGVKREKPVEVLQRQSKDLSPTARQLTYQDENKQTQYNDSLDKDAKDRLKLNQGQWEQANKIVGDMLSNFAGNRKDIDLLLNIQEPDGPTYQKVISATDIKAGKLPDIAGWNLEDDLVSIEIDAAPGANTNVQNKVAAYNTLGVVGGQALAQVAMVDNERLGNLAQTLNRNYSAESQSRLGRFFDRVAAGGSVMQQIDPTSQYGNMARFVGTFGPEAEKVLGPYVQQAAYRYRGTEKEPDLALIRQFNSPSMNAVTAAANDPRGDIAEKLANEAASGTQDVVVNSAENQMNTLSRTRGGAYTPDELTMRVRADVAARHLLDTLPDDPFVADVSLKAGTVLPSQGVIIDTDGDVITQSVGFTDDHYLPFDLKNLNSLRGGQYVRTRQQGGLTSEDIYTAVRTGARMATVVSSSGVFSLEFDPNFRGARANSDKARQMYDRYIKILDAVENSGLYVQDITPAEKAKIDTQARQIAGNDEQEFRAVQERLLSQRRLAGQNIDDDTVQELEAQARQQVELEGRKYSQDRLERRVSDVFDELVSAEQTKRVSQLRLNAKGYDVALQTLQQQFPYFIRSASYQPLTSAQGGFLQGLRQGGQAGARQKLGSTDKGYVRPGGLRAERVKSGTYRTTAGVQPKAGMEETEEPTTATTAATDTSVATTATRTSAPLPKSNLVDVIQRSGRSKMTEANTAFKKFETNTVSAMGQPSINMDESTEWDTVKEDDITATAFLINNNIKPGAATKAFESDPSRVAGLLSDPENVRAAINRAYSGYIGAGFIPLGANSLDDAVKQVTDFGNSLKDMISYSEPFVAPNSDGAFHTGSVPQLLPDVQNFTDASEVMNYFQSNSSIYSAAVDLGAGSVIPSNKDLATNASELVNALNKLKSGVKPMRLAAAEENKQEDLSDLAYESEIDDDLAKRALGESLSSNIKAVNEDSLTLRARDIQNAWSGLTAYNYLSEIPKAGGDEAPKVQKNLAGRLSRQVRVVSKSDPLSIQVQQRRKLGLPLL